MKKAGYVLLTLFAVAAALWLLGPRETFERTAFDPATIGDDLDAWAAAREAGTPDLTPGAGREIVWADPAAKAKTPLALVYLHGFSATKEEIRPVVDDVAAALGANLFYARLAGHGRGAAAMAEPRAGDWWRDTQEAVEVGRRLGERVILIGASTGATLATLAVADEAAGADVAGLIAVSPNYLFKGAPIPLLTAPFARQVLPVALGAERSWEPMNDEQAKWWTTTYPLVAVLPMAATVAEAATLNYRRIDTPALMIFNDADEVVDHAVTRAVAKRWGAPVEIVNLDVAPGEAPSNHIIAGRIVAPSATKAAADAMIRWLEAQEGR